MSYQSNKEKYEGFFTVLILCSLILTTLSAYWQCAPVLAKYGMTSHFVDIVLLMFKEYFAYPIKIKLFTLILIFSAATFRIGQRTDYSWTFIIFMNALGISCFMLMPANGFMYALTSFIGMSICVYSMTLIFRKFKKEEEPDEDYGFEQNTRLINTKYSVNIPYEFKWKNKTFKGWLNFINPFRATLVLGSPGSGKSYAIYNAFIEQMLRKNYTMFLYDYKFPDLSERVLTEIAYQSKNEGLWKKTKVKPNIYILNFDDPTKSHRCNPIHHSYITDPADSSEIAELIFENINKGVEKGSSDFFGDSARAFIDAIIYYLATYDPDAIYAEDNMTVIGSKKNYVNKGKYCTFPHVIELMALNYKKTFQILQFTKGLEAKIIAFVKALEDNVMEQLMGQVASAQIPLARFVSPQLYWVMSGDDFTLDVNNPKSPKIVLAGNNPDRQTIYSTTLALYTSRMFKQVNHKKKLPIAILLDEVPTVKLKGLDQTIATIRGNKGAVVAGAQDESQFKRDYGEKESEVIIETIGNLVSGSVTGRTAKRISESFGKEYKKKVSQSINDDSTSYSVSYQQEDILPVSKIVDMSQGTFCGWVKDNFSDKIKRKKFYGDVIVDLKRNEKLEACYQEVPIITNLFGDNPPEMDAANRNRLALIYPDIADNDKELYKKYISELVKIEIDKNFNQIKADVQEIIRKEMNRTNPIAKRYREENGIED